MLKREMTPDEQKKHDTLSPEQQTGYLAALQSRDDKAEAKKAKDRERKAKAKEAETGIAVKSSDVSIVKKKADVKEQRVNAEAESEAKLPDLLSQIGKQTEAAKQHFQEAGTLYTPQDVSGEEYAPERTGHLSDRSSEQVSPRAEQDSFNSIYGTWMSHANAAPATSSSAALNHAIEQIDYSAEAQGENSRTQKVHDHVDQALWHLTQHEEAHANEDHEAALGHLTEASTHVRLAAKGIGDGFRIQHTIGKLRPQVYTDSVVQQYSKENNVSVSATVPKPTRADLTPSFPFPENKDIDEKGAPTTRTYSGPLSPTFAARDAAVKAGDSLAPISDAELKSGMDRLSGMIGDDAAQRRVEKLFYNKKELKKQEKPIKFDFAARNPSPQLDDAKDGAVVAQNIELKRHMGENFVRREDPSIPRAMKTDEDGNLVYIRPAGPELPVGTRSVHAARARLGGQGPLDPHPYAMDAFEAEHGPRPGRYLPTNYDRLLDEDKAPFKAEKESQEAWDAKYAELVRKPGAEAYLKSRTSQFGKGQEK